MQELKQTCDKNVWHAIDIRGLTCAERKAIIRSSMILKDKYMASGAFEKFKARLVAGGWWRRARQGAVRESVVAHGGDLFSALCCSHRRF
jgi:hypothetical protein